MPEPDLKSLFHSVQSRLDDIKKLLISSQKSNPDYLDGLNELRKKDPAKADELLATHIAKISEYRQKAICNKAESLRVSMTQMAHREDNERRDKEKRDKERREELEREKKRKDRNRRGR